MKYMHIAIVEVPSNSSNVNMTSKDHVSDVWCWEVDSQVLVELPFFMFHEKDKRWADLFTMQVMETH